MFYALEKNSEKPYGGGGLGWHPPTLVRPRVNRLSSFNRNLKQRLGAPRKQLKLKYKKNPFL